MPETDLTLGSSIRRGLGWGATSALLLRLGNVTLGIVLARLLSPEQFGVFAVGLMVQAILITLADLGMSADLVRAENPVEREPTVATVSVTAALFLAILMGITASPLAAALGAADADVVIMVMALSLPITNLGVVPSARLTRTFAQKQLFFVAAIDLVVGTVVTLFLVSLGVGAIAIAIGRLSAQACATLSLFILARARLRFGYDRTIARGALSFGVPLAVANMLSFVVLNIDNSIIARAVGPMYLGYYVLAFNMSNWPMSAIGQTVRSVSLAAFSQVRRRGGSSAATSSYSALSTAIAVTWACAVPAGVCLAALATPLVRLVYGSDWAPAAGVLAALGVFGALRVVLDLIATFLTAQGWSRAVLVIQVVWIVALTPALIVAVRRWGIVGAGWAHLVIGLGVVLPVCVVALRSLGVPAGDLALVMLRPLLGAVPCWATATIVARSVSSDVTAVLLGGSAAVLVYCLVMCRWGLRLRREFGRSSTEIAGDHPSMVLMVGQG